MIKDKDEQIVLTTPNPESSVPQENSKQVESKQEHIFDTESNKQDNNHLVPKDTNIHVDLKTPESISGYESEKYTDPIVNELPEPIKQLVSEGSKEARSIGDGTCLIGTTSLHITGDLLDTEQISRDLNRHIAYRPYRPYYLCKIQADFPMTLIIGVDGKKIHFRRVKRKCSSTGWKNQMRLYIYGEAVWT